MNDISKQVREDLRLQVDENNLMEEWQGQAAMMLDYGIRLADAQQEEDETRAALAVVAAECDANIRDAPEDYGLTKVTEAAVAAAIPATDEHQEASKAYSDARHAVRVLQAAVNALQHRKSTLQGMTDLWLRQYYADPKSSSQPSELRDAAGPPSKAIPGRRKRRAGSSD